MKGQMISGFKTPDFKSILLNLKTAKKAKVESPKKKKTSKTTDKKAKAKETEKKISSELKSIVKDVSKAVGTKNVETRDLKRKIVDLQAQSAVYNQDISMLLAAIAMLETKPPAFTSLTASMASGIEAMQQQASSLEQASKKAELDCLVAHQREADLQQSIAARVRELEAAEDQNEQLGIELSTTEDQLLAAQTHDAGHQMSELHGTIETKKKAGAELEARLASLRRDKVREVEVIAGFKHKRLLLAEDTARVERLLKEDRVKSDILEQELATQRTLATELKRQAADWSDKNREKWAEVDVLIETCKEKAAIVGKLTKSVEHLREEAAHLAGSLAKKSAQLESSRQQKREGENRLKRLKAYAQDLEQMHSSSLHEVKLMRRSLCR